MNSLPEENNPYSADSNADTLAPARTSGKAIASLVLGILSIVTLCNIFTGIPAIILGALGMGDIRGSRGKLRGAGLAVTGIVTGAIGSTMIVFVMLSGLLLPAIQAARQAARKNGSSNNMKQIGLATYNFLDAKKEFPPAARRDEAGNPLWSWRVAVLPYMEGAAIFEKFNKHEPWDGPANRQWVERVPGTYVSPNDDGRQPGETNVLGIVGEDTVLTREGGLTLRDVTDGVSRTIIAAELAGGGIAWSEPRDITIDEFVAAMRRSPSDDGLRPLYPGGALCLFADGSVRFVSDDTPAEVLHAYCTRAGGENVPPPGS